MEPRARSIAILLVSLAIGAFVALMAARTLRRTEPTPPPRVRTLPSGLLRTTSTPQKVEVPRTNGGSAVADEPPSKPATPRPVGPGTEGCGSEPDFIGSGKLSIGLSEKLAVHVPERYDPNHRYMILMLFHDDAQKAFGFMRVTGFTRVADDLGFVIVAPQDDNLMAWSKNLNALVAQNAVKAVSKRLCVDTSSVYAVGYGAGGRVVEALPCLMEVSGIATVSYRSTSTDKVCKPKVPVPYIHLAPMKDGYSPVKGGRGCGGGHVAISLEAKEKMWRARNHCKGEAREYLKSGETECLTWDCGDTPFASCHVDGGRRWPGTSPRIFDLKKCDGPSAEFAFAETIWHFFSHGTGS